MYSKKIPMRSCVITKEKFPKQELLRVVRTPEGKIVIDNEKGKMNGRGAYIKKDISIIEKAQKTKALEHHLEVAISDEIYDELKNRSLR